MKYTLRNGFIAWKMDQHTYVLSDLGTVIFVSENFFLLYEIDHRVLLLVDDLFRPISYTDHVVHEKMIKTWN